MRGWLGLLLAAGIAAGQKPIAVVRGTLVDGIQSASGEMAVRTDDNQVYWFRCDPLAGKGLRAGDRVEVETQPALRPGIRRGAVRLVARARRFRAVPQVDPLEAGHSPMDDLFPRGNLTFSGTVLDVSTQRLVLRTRTNGEASILLLPETRFIHDGIPVAGSGLAINAHVFVRGGKNLDDEIEAYQVMWGEILKPN